jgi:hypothetical protein
MTLRIRELESLSRGEAGDLQAGTDFTNSPLAGSLVRGEAALSFKATTLAATR